MLIATADLVSAAPLERLLPGVVTLLREALEVVGIEKQRTVPAVGTFVVNDLGQGRPAGMQPTLAERLFSKLCGSKLSPAPRLVPTASASSGGPLIYQGRCA